MSITPKTERLVVASADGRARLDQFLAAQLPDLSRTRIQELIEEGRVRVNGRAAKPSYRVQSGEAIEVEAVPRPSLDARAEAIPLEILYEDPDLVVVNKPSGMVVHAGAGNASGTLVNALMHRYAKLSKVGGPLRPGIVHRLDKLTSGAIVVARTDEAHRNLAEQFQQRAVGKHYVALVHGRLAKDSGSIALPVARDLKRRTRMTTRRSSGREAHTDWRVVARLDGFTLVEARIHTGRTHQIRVHFSAISHPVVGDATYGAPAQVRAGRDVLPALGRNFLHAARIFFKHPRTRAMIGPRAPLPAELRDYLRRMEHALGLKPGFIDDAAREFL